MRIFHIHSSGVTELPELPAQAPAQGFLWIAVARPAFQAYMARIDGRASVQKVSAEDVAMAAEHEAAANHLKAG